MYPTVTAHKKKSRSKSRRHREEKTSPTPSIAPSIATSTFSASSSVTREGIMIQRLNNLKQQQINTVEHIVSLKEEVQRQKQRMEHSLYSTFHILKSELERYLHESLEDLNQMEQTLIAPLSAQADAVSAHTAALQTVIEKLGTGTSDREYYFQQANKLMNEKSMDSHVDVPDFGQLTNRHHFTICNLSLNYNSDNSRSRRIAEKPDVVVSLKETDEQEDMEMMAQLNGLRSKLSEKPKAYLSSSDSDSSAMSSIFSTSGYETDSSETESDTSVEEPKKKHSKKHSKHHRHHHHSHGTTKPVHGLVPERQSKKSEKPKTTKPSQQPQQGFYPTNFPSTIPFSQPSHTGVSDTFRELANIYQSAKKHKYDIKL